MSPVGNISSSSQKQETVIEQFLEWYTMNQSGYDRIAKESAQRLTQVLGEAGVPHKIDCRTKAPERLRIKVNRRKGHHEYENIKDIVKDIVDLAGARVLVYFASDKDRVKKLISENFDVDSNPQFNGTDILRNIGTSHQYLPKYPGYCADHYRATLKLANGAKKERWQKFRVEIQVTTILRHTWAEVSHDWNYKQLVPGGDDEYCHLLLDAFSGAVEMGEFFLEKMQQTLATQKEQGDREFSSQYDLGLFLTEWAAGRTQHLVDVQTLWEVLKCFKAHRPTKLRRILDGLDLSPELARQYEPLPLNIETSIIHSILVSDERYKRQRELDKANLDKVQKYRLKVVRDCFIWFGRLFRFNNKWFALLTSGNDQKRVLENIEWLVNQSMKEGEPLSSSDERILDNMFEIFERHGRPTVQYVFFLARLRVKTFEGDGYAMRSVIKPLLDARALQQRWFC